MKIGSVFGLVSSYVNYARHTHTCTRGDPLPPGFNPATPRPFSVFFFLFFLRQKLICPPPIWPPQLPPVIVGSHGDYFSISEAVENANKIKKYLVRTTFFLVRTRFISSRRLFDLTRRTFQQYQWTTEDNVLCHGTIFLVGPICRILICFDPSLESTKQISSS